jgi:hypothetical protein
MVYMQLYVILSSFLSRSEITYETSCTYLASWEQIKRSGVWKEKKTTEGYIINNAEYLIHLRRCLIPDLKG